jgi:hypothetical protein
MRNDLLITARRAHIEQRKGYKDAQSAPKGTQERAKIQVAERNGVK